MITLSEYAVLELVRKYIQFTNKHYFTYDSIKVFASKSGFYKEYRITDRTIDRTLRELARKGFFNRKERTIFDNTQDRRKRIVFYSPTQRFYEYSRKH